MILGLLLGNSSLRHAVWVRGSILESGRVEWGDLDRRAADIDRSIARHRIREAVIGSVRDDLLERAIERVPPGVPVLVARRDFPLPIENRYERPEEAGTDRLLNAIAAHARAGGAPAIAVDFGTAISVTVVSREGAFLGGLIAAGGTTVARGLALSAPRLPAVEPALPPAGSFMRFIRNDTVSALRAGLYHQVAGGVRAMIQGIFTEIPWGPPLTLATGGEAALFAPWIPEIQQVVPDLGLEGLFRAHAAWRAAR
jgi:type III pantothenate kinase